MAAVEEKKQDQHDHENEEKKQSNDKEDNNSIPRYVVNCSANPMKEQPLQEISIEHLLQKIIPYKNIYGYGIDIYDKKQGFAAVNFSFRGIKNNFISALHACFMNHWPLQLRPDDIWIIIAQGIATHITQNAEKLREKIVSFDGMKDIVVIDDSLKIGSKTNDWSFVLNQFEKGCRKLSNDKIVDIITCNFSTTTSSVVAASQCVLFKALSEYINFRTMTRSGIPNITLIGSVDDWKNIQQKCKEIKKMNIGLKFWLPHLMPIIDNIIESVTVLSEGNKLKDELIKFWDSIYSYQSMSGGASVTGWAKSLFPYIGIMNRKNTELDWTKGFWAHVSPGDFPATYSMCPMKWTYCGKDIDCGMYGGIIGMAQQPKTRCIAPVIGWVIAKR